MGNKLKIKKDDSIFGHTHEFTGYGLDVPYLSYDTKIKGVIDGIDRQHIDLYGVCDKCNKKILVAKIHVDSNSVLYGHSELK